MKPKGRLEVSDQTESVSINKRPGPKPKAKIDVEALQKRVEGLEQLVLRMAHNSGTSRGVILKSGLTPWEPEKADMHKYK